MAFTGQVSTNKAGTITWGEYTSWLEGYLHSHIGELSSYQLENIYQKLKMVRARDYDTEQSAGYATKPIYEGGR